MVNTNDMVLTHLLVVQSKLCSYFVRSHLAVFEILFLNGYFQLVRLLQYEDKNSKLSSY